MKLTFWGAARQVTGSMHMLQLDSGYTILIDCGLDYEKKEEFENNNKNFPFFPEDIDLVILTHAHIDHSGNLPNLIRQGYKGQILCTSASVELTKNLLLDSLNVQRIESNKKNKPSRGKIKRMNKSEQIATLYNRSHIEQTHDVMVGLNFNHLFEINDELSLEFFNAGHILGAASVKLTVKENGITKTIGFTGDLGNYNAKLVVDPMPMNGLDYIVTESTYGGRFHHDSTNAEQLLLDYINNTCVKYRGKLVIPAFSVGRTQSIIFTLNQLYAKGKMPDVKVYTDSPLAIRTTKLYAEHVDMLNDEAKEFYKTHGNLFNFPNLYTLESSSDSRLISTMPEAAVIISAAGMVEGGRIQEHVRYNIGDAYSTILIAGYCAEGTLGYELLKGRPFVTINKKQKQVYAKIVRTDAFSAHPDQNGLMKYLQDSNYKQLKKIFLVHGDPISLEMMKKEIGLDTVEIPAVEQSFDL